MSSAKRSPGGAFQAERKTKHNSNKHEKIHFMGFVFPGGGSDAGAPGPILEDDVRRRSTPG